MKIQLFHCVAAVVALTAAAAAVVAVAGSVGWAVALFTLALAGTVVVLVLFDRRTQLTFGRQARRSASRPMPAVSEQVAADLVLRSGVFDAHWYARQLGDASRTERELVHHYVTEGHRAGLTATPALLEQWVRDMHQKGTTAEAPLVHYLRRRKETTSLHPLFPATEYVARHPESVDHPGGPLAHYLASDAPADGGFLAPADFLERARESAEVLFTSRGTEHLPRHSDTWDYAAEARFKADLRADGSLLADHPLVSVIVPTMNRAEPLRATIQSVLAQTYDNWELIVVDDGGTDDTPAVVAGYAETDPRIHFLRYPENRGVATARNTGLRMAKGDYVAYLDSDNEWHPDFLEIMLRHLERSGAEVGYSATELVEEGGRHRRAYRGMPFDREALRERNFIDCITIVHRRSLLETTGAFDESLRRTVDWDLLIRMADVTTPAYAPIIGSTYDVWDQRGSRITTDVSEGYRFRVRQRALVRWDDVRHRAASTQDGLSIVVAVNKPAEVTVVMLRRLLAATASDHELIVVDNHLPPQEAVLLRDGLRDEAAVRYHRISAKPLPREVALNVGGALASRRAVAFVDEDLWVSAGWDVPLLEALPAYAAVQPLVLAANGSVWSAGSSFATGRHTRLFVDMAGDSPEVRGTLEVDAVTNTCLVLRTADYAAAEGFDPLYLRHPAGADLSVAARKVTGLPAAAVGASVVAFRSEVEYPDGDAALLAALRNEIELARAWDATGLAALDPYAGSEVRPAAHVHQSAREPQVTPQFVHTNSDRPLRWAIKIGPSAVAVRDWWGDYHFANALRDELEALGHIVTVDGRGAWYRPTAHLDDVVVSLQGRGRYLPAAGQVNVLWVMSHPEESSLDELANFDIVFSSSRVWLDLARRHARREPEMLLQCTDARRFHPVEADPAKRHEVLMVGNARRDATRPSVAAALEAGLLPAVYGQRWAEFVPAEAVKGDYLPNEELAAYYASAGVVLNDHWDDMREWGIMSNRLFDLAACGARIVSDDVEGVDEVFGGNVLVYHSPTELRAHVERLLAASPEDDARRAALAEHVTTHHTFAARAATISERVMAVLRETGEDPRQRATAR